MSDDVTPQNESTRAPGTPDSVIGGWLTLAGLLIGVLAGALSGDPIVALPVLMALGTALGVGAESLITWRVRGRDRGLDGGAHGA